MSTDILPDAQSPAPPQRAMARYRDAVLNTGRIHGADPLRNLEEILVEVGLLRFDFDRDLDVFRRRVKAREKLDVEVPRLEAEARRLLTEAAAERSGASGEVLLATLRTVAELHAALERFRLNQDPRIVPHSRVRAHEMENNACTEKQEAVRYLLRTADPAITARIDQLVNRVQDLESQIAQRNEVLNAPGVIARLRAEAEELARTTDSGWRSPVGLQTVNGQDLILGPRERLHRVRQQIQYFSGLLPQRKAALRANEKDAAEIDQVNRQREKLEAERLLPENMDFARG